MNSYKINTHLIWEDEQVMNLHTNYGLNIIWRKYLGLPDDVPLLCNYIHGVHFLDHPLNSQHISNDIGLNLANNKRQAELWESIVKTRSVVAGTPFIHFRRMNKIEQDVDAAGTIIFPAHSTHHASQEYNLSKFCDLLNSLPDKCKPITIHLHVDDIINGRNKFYEDKGFNVITAGNYFDPDYPNVFYNNIKSFKYAASNQIGSCLFYCLEMGIPCFLIGESPLLKFKPGTVDLPSGYHDLNKLTYIQDFLKLLPNEPVDYISNELRLYVNKTLGIDDQLPPEKIRKLIINNYKKKLFIERVHKIPYATKILKFVEKNTRSISKIFFPKVKKEPYYRTGAEITIPERINAWNVLFDGDKTLRLDYELDENSIVFEIGIPEPEWKEDLIRRYNPVIHNRDYLNNDIERIDLMKIDMEGQEYEFLDFIINSGVVNKIHNLQIKFYNNVEDSDQKMQVIQDKLSNTHKITYGIEYVWENWKLKEPEE